jgi:hypothetical protein
MVDYYNNDSTNAHIHTQQPADQKKGLIRPSLYYTYSKIISKAIKKPKERNARGINILKEKGG